MQQVYIPSERIRALKKDRQMLKDLENASGCSITIEDETITISSENGYNEFNAKNIVHAYGRGFNLRTAELLLNEDYYFASIDIGILGSEKRVHRVKSRIIGENGRTKTYIENVSGAKLSVYGDTVSFIGSHSQISEAQTAVEALLHGATHKLAYSKMEAAHRKNKEDRRNAAF